jgi:hypothetical protein
MARSVLRGKAAHPSDGILDAAFLPGRVGVAEEGVDRQAVQRTMASKLGTVVEGNGLTLRWRHDAIDEIAGDAVGSLADQPPDGQQKAGLALMHGQDRLTVFCEHHQIGFPMTSGFAIGSLDRPLCRGNTAFNEVWRASALSAAASSFALAAWQIPSPAIVFGTGDLGIDGAIDALVGNHLTPVLTRKPAGDLFRRPAFVFPVAVARRFRAFRALELLGRLLSVRLGGLPARFRLRERALGRWCQRLVLRRRFSRTGGGGSEGS